jgi:hypothetical protein
MCIKLALILIYVVTASAWSTQPQPEVLWNCSTQFVLGQFLSVPLNGVHKRGPFKEAPLGIALENAHFIETEISSRDSALVRFFTQFGQWRSVNLDRKTSGLGPVDPQIFKRPIALYRIHWGNSGKVVSTSIVEGKLTQIPRRGPTDPNLFVLEQVGTKEQISLTWAEVGALHYQTPDCPTRGEFEDRYWTWLYIPVPPEDSAREAHFDFLEKIIGTHSAFYVFNRRSGNSRIVEGYVIQSPSRKMKVANNTYSNRFFIADSENRVHSISPNGGDEVERVLQHPVSPAPLELTPALEKAIKLALEQEN